MSKNMQIILEEINALGLDFEYDGSNLFTFIQWKNNGMSVKKGEKAFLQVPLWTPYETKEKDENGKEVKVTKFILKKASLFTADQVQPIKESKGTKKAKTTKTKKATSKTKAPKKVAAAPAPAPVKENKPVKKPVITTGELMGAYEEFTGSQLALF